MFQGMCDSEEPFQRVFQNNANARDRVNFIWPMRILNRDLALLARMGTHPGLVGKCREPDASLHRVIDYQLALIGLLHCQKFARRQLSKILIGTISVGGNRLTVCVACRSRKALMPIS